MDVHSKETRSYNMSMIKGKNTKPEIIVRKFLFSNGLRYRVNVKDLPGKPDIVLKKYNTIVLVNGCFWHGHEDCSIAHIPKSRVEWWQEKITKNKERDKLVYQQLKQLGWDLILIWECQLKKGKREETLLNLLCQIKKIVST